MKKLYSGVAIAAVLFFSVQGMGVAEELNLDAKDSGAATITETQVAPQEGAAVISDKKEDVKKKAEEATNIVLQGDTVPAPTADSKV